MNHLNFAISYNLKLQMVASPHSGICLSLMLSHFSRVRLSVIPLTVASQAPLSMGFSRQEYWSGLPGSPPGDLSNQRIEPMSPMSPTLAGGFFTISDSWEAHGKHHCCLILRNYCSYPKLWTITMLISQQPSISRKDPTLAKRLQLLAEGLDDG